MQLKGISRHVVEKCVRDIHALPDAQLTLKPKTKESPKLSSHIASSTLMQLLLRGKQEPSVLFAFLRLTDVLNAAEVGPP